MSGTALSKTGYKIAMIVQYPYQICITSEGCIYAGMGMDMHAYGILEPDVHDCYLGAVRTCRCHSAMARLLEN